jgi:hypothetical protein
MTFYFYHLKDITSSSLYIMFSDIPHFTQLSPVVEEIMVRIRQKEESIRRLFMSSPSTNILRVSMSGDGVHGIHGISISNQCISDVRNQFIAELMLTTGLIVELVCNSQNTCIIYVILRRNMPSCHKIKVL